MLWVLPLIVVGATPDVVVCPPEDRALAPRIEGQLADLEAEVAWPAGCPSVTSPTIWVRGRPTQGYRIVFEAPGRAAKARRIEALESVSATREAAALAVRSVVKAVMMGIEPAWAEAPEEASPSAPKWRARAAAGLEASLTGIADPALAVTVRGGVREGDRVLELAGSFGLPRTFEATRATVRLVEHALWGAAGVVIASAGPFEATAIARAGVAFGRRSTVEVGAGVTGRPDDNPLVGFGGLATRGAIRVVGGLRVELIAGADGVLGAPRLLYGRGGETEVAASGWLIRPRAGLFVTIETGGDSP